jgi:hypothetical protein
MSRNRTLKESFIRDAIKGTIRNDVEIAERFAIGFLDWIYYDKNNYAEDWHNGYYSTPKLLEIYKKEKGL